MLTGYLLGRSGFCRTQECWGGGFGRRGHKVHQRLRVEKVSDFQDPSGLGFRPLWAEQLLEDCHMEVDCGYYQTSEGVCSVVSSEFLDAVAVELDWIGLAQCCVYPLACRNC